MNDEQFSEKLPVALQEAFAAREGDRGDLKAFLTGLVEADDAEAILDMVREIRGSDREIKAARERASGPQKWLGQRLQGLGTELLDAGIADHLDPELMPSEAARHLIESAMVSTREALTDAVIASPTSDTHESSLAREFLDSELGAEVEDEVTAVATGAVVKLGKGLGASVDPIAVTGVVDMGLRTAKLGYKLSKGELNPDEVLEEIEDRTAAVIGAGAALVARRGAEMAGTAIGGFIGTFLGNSAGGAQVGRQVGRMAGAAAAPHVQKGMQMVAKKVLSTARKEIPRKAEKAWKWLFG